MVLPSVAHATFCSCSCPARSCCGAPVPFLFPSPSRRPRLGTQRQVVPSAPKVDMPSPSPAAQVCSLVIHKYISPLASHTGHCPLSGLPFNQRSQRLIAVHLLQRLCPSFIHSFHRAVLHVHFLTRKKAQFFSSSTVLPTTHWQQKADSSNQWLDPKTYGIQDKDRDHLHSRQHSSVASLHPFGSSTHPPSFIFSSKGQPRS